MKNIVFDLGGVLFARDKSKCTPELLEFFSFLRAPRMPLFWGARGRKFESCHPD